MTFYNGGTSLGTAMLSSGVATFNIGSLPVGTDILTASYSGDAFFSASVSATIEETIVGPNYSLTISPGASTVTQGGSAQETVTVSPAGGFQQQISFSCSGLPSYSVCSFSPPTVMPDGTNTAQKTTLTVSTHQATAALHSPQIRNSGRRGNSSLVASAFVLLGLCVLPMLGKPGRALDRKYSTLILLISLMCVGATAMVGCGGGGSGSTVAANTTPAGNYTVTVTGMAGSNLQTTKFTLTVQ